MFFQRASFVFSCLGADFGARDQIFGPRVNMLARGPFWIDFGVPKNILLLRNDVVVAVQGNPRDPNEFYGP